MKIREVNDRNHNLLQELCLVWKRAVEATHHFLSAEEIDALNESLPTALCNIPHLLVVMDEKDSILAFVGIREHDIDLLFVDPTYHKQGIGKFCIQYAIEHFQIDSLCVNEQNPQARGFYEHMGFSVIKRSECDEQGRPYPLLYMKLNGGNKTS